MSHTVVNKRLLFNKVPNGYPELGVTLKLDTTHIDLDIPLDGGILIKTKALAIDPYIRGRMRGPSAKSYNAGFVLGEPILNFGIGVVLRSENPAYQVGDHIYGLLTFQEYSIIKDSFPFPFRILKNEQNFPWSVYLGTLGMPGQTAFFGWKLYSYAKAGETVFVTTAAGTVGAGVVQLAKAQGLKVVASAGSDEKVEYVKSLGADVVFNYKIKSTKDALEELGHGVDIYWDNVGSEMLEATLEAMNPFGRIIMCGGIASYNTSTPYGVKNLSQIYVKRLTIHGFIVSDILQDSAKVEEFYTEFPRLIAEGKIKHKEQLSFGLETAERAFLDTLKGDNIAKPVIVLDQSL